MDWSATQYLRFGDERTRPARDLLGAVPHPAPAEIIDLGCGPGNSTELLVDRFPTAVVTGLDSSPDMLARARRQVPTASFELAAIESWNPGKAYDLIFANAVLQWLPDHAALLSRLVGYLTPGGVLAVQMPDNLNEPSHASMREAARSGPWAARLADADEVRTPILTPAGYYAVLSRLCSRIDLWKTIYHHPLVGPRAIVEWFASTGLRPYLARLQEDEKPEFLAAYERLIEARYPLQPDGKVLLAFPRLFIVAMR